jgi:energy-coupling factor transporter ATP-binding protein EcfA2
LRIRDFRGWVGDRDPIDTDAEVVLLTGSNGCGKTSLLEAVNLLVNGHAFDLRGESRSEGQRLEDLTYGDRSGFALEAEARGGNDKLRATFQRGAQGLERDDLYWSKLVDELSAPPPDLLAAATTYFQDRIDFILRDLDRGITLRDFLAPLPPVVREMRERIKRIPAELRREADYEEHRLRADRRPHSHFREKAGRFRAEWESVRRRESWLDLPVAPEDLDLRQDQLSTRLTDWLGDAAPADDDLASLGRLLGTAIERIEQRLRERRRDQLDSPRARLEKAAAELRRKLAELDESHPIEMTERVLAQFAGGDEPGSPSLREVLRAVEVQLFRWRDLAPGLPAVTELEPVSKELARLDVGAAGVLRASLDHWLAPWQEADRVRRRLTARLDEIQRESGRDRVVAGIEDLRRAMDDWRRTWDEERERRLRLARATRIRAEIEARRRLAEVLQIEAEDQGAFAAVQPLDVEVKEELAKALDGTLVRFQFDSGFLPVRPQDDARERRDEPRRHGYQLFTRDRRPSFVLSTGQKGQVALAYMLAQALLLRRQLPHRILMLDDTSTAFDLGNIVRQATWLRQLAYSGPPDQRWQIFIASHHEDLTNRLIELLVPPEGRELRLIRFLGWTPEHGPQIEPRRARPNKPVDSDEVERLETQLERAWSSWSVRRASNL